MYLELRKPAHHHDRRVDAGAIPPYTGSHDSVDAHQSEHLANLQRWLKQVSISAENNGITAMAEVLRTDLQRLGFGEAELVETSGHPGVWAYYDAGAPRAIVIYMMYDVQPVRAEDWRSPSFEAEVIETPQDRAVMARGAINQKGPERAFLNALESILGVRATLPVNLMIVAEREEELGSVHHHRRSWGI